VVIVVATRSGDERRQNEPAGHDVPLYLLLRTVTGPNGTRRHAIARMQLLGRGTVRRARHQAQLAIRIGSRGAIEEDRDRPVHRRARAQLIERQKRKLALTACNAGRILAANLRSELAVRREWLDEREQSTDERGAVAQLERCVRELDRERRLPRRRRKRLHATCAIDEHAVAIARGRDRTFGEQKVDLARVRPLGEWIGPIQCREPRSPPASVRCPLDTRRCSRRRGT
jgi:hypothetical protein